VPVRQTLGLSPTGDADEERSIDRAARAMRIGFASPLLVGELLPWLDVKSGTALPTGLGGNSATTLLTGLLEAGHSVAAVTLDQSLESPVTLRGERLTLRIGPYRDRHRARDYFRRERAFVRSSMLAERPDVIGAHWSYEFALGSLEVHIPTVVSLNDWAPTILRLMGWRVSPYYTVRLAMHTETLLRAGALTANSPTTAHRAARWVRRPVPVVPNAFDDCLFARVSRRLNLDRPRVLAANNGFNRLKNTTTLLEAFATARRDLPQARLSLAGVDHGPGGRAAQWARGRGLAEGVEFLGPIPHDELLRLMGVVQLFVHTSREESFGNVLVEAMAQGTPVVGGRASGAVPWVLDDGRAGLLTDIERPLLVADAIVSLLSNPKRWEGYSSNGKRISKSRFSVSRVADQYAEVLERHLAARQPES